MPSSGSGVALGTGAHALVSDVIASAKTTSRRSSITRKIDRRASGIGPSIHPLWQIAWAGPTVAIALGILHVRRARPATVWTGRWIGVALGSCSSCSLLDFAAREELRRAALRAPQGGL